MVAAWRSVGRSTAILVSTKAAVDAKVEVHCYNVIHPLLGHTWSATWGTCVVAKTITINNHQKPPQQPLKRPTATYYNAL